MKELYHFLSKFKKAQVLISKIFFDFKLISLLLLTLTIGCQYNIPAIHKEKAVIAAPTTDEYTPAEAPKQIIKPNEEAKLPGQDSNLAANEMQIKIALLVPLSGNYKELGQGLLNAAQLALFKVGNANLILLPIDTKDSTYGAVEAAKKAVAVGANIILGPIFSSGAKAIAKIATENNIQVISFSNDNSLAGTGVFAIGFIPEQQVRRIVNFAIEKGIKEFVTLLPKDAYGTTVTKELQQLLAGNKDVSVLRSESYPLDAQGRVIKLEEHAKDAFDAASSGNPVAPRAILLPSSSVNAAKMVDVLNKNSDYKSKIQLLGNDQWYVPEILANSTFEGAWFTAFPRERRHEFENKFKEIYGYDTPKLGGLAFDGIALVATLAKLGGQAGFSREALTNPRGFIGVDGIFRLQEDGLVTRGFAIMSIKNGRAVIIDPAPTSFTD